MEPNPHAPATRVRLLLGLNLILLAAIVTFVFAPGYLRELLGNAFMVAGAVVLVATTVWAWRQPHLRPRVRQASLRLPAIMFTILATQGLLEMAVRVVDPGGISYYSEAERYHQLATVPDLHLRYRHRRRFDDIIDKVEVKINSRGLRDVERPLAKPANTFRLIVLGDSVPFGWGVPLEKTFTRLMEYQLNVEDRGPRYDVINTGVCSYDTRDEVEYLKREGLNYEPDCVLLFFVPNDLNTILTQRGTTEVFGHRTEHGPLAERALQCAINHSRTAQLIWHRFAVAPDRAHWFDPASAHWMAARSQLLELRDLCRRRRLPLVLFGVFANDGRRGQRAAERTREFAEEAKVPWVACDDFFENKNYRRYVNSSVDPHWNAAGHELVAASVLRELRRLAVVP